MDLVVWFWQEGWLEETEGKGNEKLGEYQKT